MGSPYYLDGAHSIFTSDNYVYVASYGNDALSIFEIAPDQVNAFVTRFYTLCLERPPDQSGLGYWVATLKDGSMTGEDIAYGFIFSDEFLAHKHPDSTYISILYNVFFDRVPDKTGYNYWMNVLSTHSRQPVCN